MSECNRKTCKLSGDSIPELGDGEPSPPPVNYDRDKVRQLEREIELQPGNKFVGWKLGESGAAQEVSPPSPTVVSVARSTHSIASGYTTVGGNSAITECGDTRELKAAVDNLKAARTAWHEDYGVPISAKYAEFLEAIGKLTDEVERLLGEPTKEPQ